MRILGTVASSSREVPGAPTIGTATDVGTARAYNNGAATVTFTAPTFDGGLPITSYTVTSSPGGFTGTGASSPVTVAGLASSTAYTFTVTATNSRGTGAASAASNSVTATTVPQAPTIGTATAGNASATVTYTAGATGGKAVSVYTATSSPGSQTGTGASPITVSGLTNGTAYTFTVTATNANGTSTASAASNSITPVVPVPYYVVISDNGQSQPNSMNSSNGINWTSANLPSNESWTKIVYTNGTWVAINNSNTTTRVITSTDGTTWTTRTAPTSSKPVSRNLAANGSTLVAITQYDPAGPPYSTERAVYSTNTGSTWTGVNVGIAEQWQTMAYGSNGFLSVSVTNGKIVYSSDGITWSNASFGETREWADLAYGSSKYVAAFAAYGGDGNCYIRYGTVGSWTSSSFSFPNTYIVEMIFQNNLFVISGGSFNGSTARIATSSNGTSWTVNNAPSNSYLGSKSYSATTGLWIMVLRDSTTSYTSPDAITWTTRTSADNRSWQSSATRG
jgi:hypothetical protein